MAKIDAFFKLMAEQGASDLHLVSGQQPILRVRGEMERVKYDVLKNDELRAMLYEIAPEVKIKQFEETGDVDFGYEIPGLARYRANFFNQKYGCAAVFRQIPTKVLSAEQLGLPPILTKAAMLKKGLVLVTGPTGSGKSTTLAGIIDHANKNRKDHIITVEDPIEFVHESQGCIVNHREVGLHTKSFGAALRGALREDPDIILVGEMRDLETIRLAVEAAATGHLVFGTLHTTNAAKTVDRVIEVFPAEEQAQIRNTLSTSLRIVVAQNLFKRVDVKGRCAALEILVCTNAIANLIRDAKTFQIPSAMQTGKKLGMQTLDDAILDLLNKKWIAPEEAYEKAIDKTRFIPLLKTPPDELSF
ncbi:MAG: type IV pili twitching motility protein PilT [Nitrospirae bacterium RIFCSPLOWO2_02_FULL_62_14]|nr:MAG: type IV pili twitching motility protein PilT [Nitrospirae bacterium RIFCSPLOWO2_02_FULL_62_14]OGW69940.1 MAG: type IV pili twitching motility protein PilT [Nitrospirae bacterium RIFCSPLOWO2_01_FULL_62_17]OGW88608.1 MAG: type IV pili twitching motility protein PilT [Nitrospirae bacterium RIFCSPLOWO2_12_FULL_63_8]